MQIPSSFEIHAIGPKNVRSHANIAIIYAREDFSSHSKHIQLIEEKISLSFSTISGLQTGKEG